MLKTEPEIDSQLGLDTRPTGLLVRYPDGRSFALQMPGGKSTLGSGAGCTIPIRYEGVSPLHCVLFSTPTGWRIRRWSAETKLNGESFTETSIDAGDHLQVGPVEIEFLDDLEPAGGDNVSDTNPVNGIFPKPYYEDSRKGPAVEVGLRFGHLKELQRLLEARIEQFRELENGWCEYRDRITAIQEDFAHLKQSCESIPDLLAEHERQLDAIRDQQEANTIWRAQSESILSGWQDELVELRQELASNRSFDSEASNRLVELSEQLGQLRNEIKQENARQFEHWDHLYNELRNQLNGYERDLQNSSGTQTELQLAKSDLEGLIQELRTKLARVAKQQEQSDSLGKEVWETIDELRQGLTNESEQLSAHQEIVADQAGLLAGLSDQVATHSSQMQEVCQRIEDLSGQLILDHGTRDEQLESLAKLARDLKETRDGFAIAPVEQQRVERELSELRQSLQLVREELIAAQQSQNSTPADLKTLWESLHARVEEISSQNERYEISLSEFQKRLDSLSSSSSEEKQTVQLIHDTLSQQGREFEELREHLGSPSAYGANPDLQQALNSLREELQELRLDRARDEQLHLATRDAVVELERQIAEYSVHGGRTFESGKSDGYLSCKELVEKPASEEALRDDSPSYEFLEASTDSFQEPESFLNKYQHLLDDNEPESVESKDDFAITSAGAFAIQAEVDSAMEIDRKESSGDEDSIEHYMSRLLQRVRAEKNSIAPMSHSEAKHEEPVVSMEEQPSKPAILPVSNLEEIKAKPAPERSRDMVALRNLANSSARNSLHEAKVRKSREYALVKLFISVFAVICGYVVMGLAPSYTSPEFIGGLVPVIVGVIWGGNMIVIIFRAIQAGSFENLDSLNERPTEIPGDLSADDL